MKYTRWICGEPRDAAVEQLMDAGYPYLVSSVLAARGVTAVEEASTDVSVLTVKLERVETDVREIKTDVKTLTEKPGKRWDGIVEKALWALAAAVIAFALARLGL